MPAVVGALRETVPDALVVQDPSGDVCARDLEVRSREIAAALPDPDLPFGWAGRDPLVEVVLLVAVLRVGMPVSVAGGGAPPTCGRGAGGSGLDVDARESVVHSGTPAMWTGSGVLTHGDLLDRAHAMSQDLGLQPGGLLAAGTVAARPVQDRLVAVIAALVTPCALSLTTRSTQTG